MSSVIINILDSVVLFIPSPADAGPRLYGAPPVFTDHASPSSSAALAGSIALGDRGIARCISTARRGCQDRCIAHEAKGEAGEDDADCRCQFFQSDLKS